MADSDRGNDHFCGFHNMGKFWQKQKKMTRKND